MIKRILLALFMFFAAATVLEIIFSLVGDVERTTQNIVELVGGLVAAGYYWWSTRPKPETDTNE